MLGAQRLANPGGLLLSPAVAGRLLDADWTPGRLLLLVAAILALGGLTVHAFKILEPTAADTATLKPRAQPSAS